ncbi:hypothetical protein [Bacillus salipaludis]|uniref:Uncharacterized protein n=1 Tax=Bacillus salipaludis TaxID=2547811 RepID=A0ABW8RDD1_9BACI
MKNKWSIILIGEKIDKKELQLTGKPSFHDAIQLTKQSPTPTKNSPYQSIPLADDKNISFIYDGCSVQVDHDKRVLSIKEGESKLTEKEAYDVLSHFVIKEGKRVSFLAFPPHRNTCPNKREKVRVLAEGKELGEE